MRHPTQHRSATQRPSGAGRSARETYTPSSLRTLYSVLITRFLPTVLYLLLVLPAHAVDTLQVTSPDPMLEAWRWTEFDKNSGLAEGIRDIYEDRDGALWFATGTGAQFYDGIRWTTYTSEDGLGHDLVSREIQARDGAMWFTTFGGGVSRFDPSAAGVAQASDLSPKQAWVTFTAGDGLPSNHTVGLHQARDGSIWVGGWNPTSNFRDTSRVSGGIARFDGESWTTIEVPVWPPRPDVFDIHQSRDGSLWFRTWRHGILRFDGRKWRRYTTRDGLASNDSRSEIFESSDGSLWAGSFYRGLGISRFDGMGWRSYAAGGELSETVGAISLWETGDGRIWALQGGGLAQFDGQRWIHYASEALPELGRPRLRVLRDGTVWLHTLRNGLSVR